MKNKYIILSILMLMLSQVHGQNKSDYLWLFSSNGESLPEKEGSFIDFRGGERDTFYQPVYLKLGSNHAVANNENGNLLFYSSGCKIADSTHQLMMNGDSINYGSTWESHCGGGSYPGIQNSLVLPDPGNRDGYYYFHKLHKLMSEPHLWLDIDLQYSYVDINLNEGKGAVTQKNVIIAPDLPNLENGYLQACMHANGRDWWLIQMKDLDNVYYKFLLDDEGVVLVDSQQMGLQFNDFTGNSGQAVFSPDGSIWMMYNNFNGALIYDFDRETGALSNYRHVEVPDSNYYFSGVAISPNSRFAYLISMVDIWQVDLWADDIQESLVHIASYDGFQDHYPVNYHLAQLGPDCRIYISSTFQVSYLSVINKPNEKGKACDFVPHGVKLPYAHLSGSMVNFPHFRIDEEDVCDPTISSVFGGNVWFRQDLMVWPNPSAGVFNVELPVAGKGQLMVTDMNGMSVWHRSLKTSTIYEGDKISIDLTNLPEGRYNVEYWPKRDMGLKAQPSNSDRVFYGAQVVKVE